jgi:hypothetical protein
MKKVLLALSLLFSVTAFAQPEGRVFTVLTGQTYTNLSNSTKITDSLWDDFDASVPLGFNFHLFKNAADTVFFDAAGFNNVGADMIFRKDSNTNMIGFCFMDLIDRSNDGIHPQSVVSYKTITQSSKKITKIEWRDVGFAYSNIVDTAYDDSLNFQVWYYENNDDLEVHFGTSKIYNNYATLFNRSPFGFSFTNPFFGFYKNYDPINNVFDTAYFVNKINPAKVDSVSIDSMLAADSLGLKVWPANGIVFKFSKPLSGINGVQLNDYASVFPTAFLDQLFINISKENFEGALFMFDMNGNIVAHQKAMNGNNVLQTSGLLSGMYIINIKSKDESVFYKVIKN